MTRRSIHSFGSIRILLTSLALLFATALGTSSSVSADVLVPALDTGGPGGGSGFAETISDPYVLKMNCPCLMEA